MTDITTESKFDNLVEVKENELEKESVNDFKEIDEIPTSLWEFSRNTHTFSEEAAMNLSKFLLKNPEDFNDEDDLLYERKEIKKPVQTKLPFIKKSEIKADSSDLESTGPGYSAETISDSSQNNRILNKNVQVVIT